MPFEILPQTLKEDVNTGKTIIAGVFQRANDKNQNGRVYPSEILKREVDRYKDECIKQRRAMGELDHPECLRPSAEILTKDGWKFIKEVVVGESVATLNLENNTLEYNPVEKTINEKYTGKMISIKGENIDTVCTPNHRFILKDDSDKFTEKTAQEIYELSTTETKVDLLIPTTISDSKIEESENILLDFKSLKVQEIDYDDTVHCVSVKNKNFYCRDQKKSFWTGNSEIVNLKNVSHTVVNLEWDGDDLIGSLEILPTPSGNILKQLIESGILLGISSRGLGSVKQDIREGSSIVQDDFNLICFDIVSNPSTYGAFLKKNTINESVNSQIKQSNKYIKIESIIKDILSDI